MLADFSRLLIKPVWQLYDYELPSSEHKLAKLGDAIAIFTSETINHSLTHSPTD